MAFSEHTTLTWDMAPLETHLDKTLAAGDTKNGDTSH